MSARCHCSCGLDFHIKCALFTFNIAENNLKELEHVPLQDPLISTENGDEELEDVSKCFGCEEELFMVVLLVRLPSTLNVYHHHPLLKIKAIRIHSLCFQDDYPSFVMHAVSKEITLPTFVVNPELGCYCCSHCNITFHAHCVTEDKYSYSIPSREDEDEISSESSITVLEWNDAKEATKIKHFKHMHNLMLSASVGGECKSRTCLRCVIALTPGARTCLKREHPLRFYRQYEGKCNACS
ncbi:hypothetical protein Goarm_023097, partial [Gossypium armourianum]|nr:hypothetical protein [Gossypium armourianum]